MGGIICPPPVGVILRPPSSARVKTKFEAVSWHIFAPWYVKWSYCFVAAILKRRFSDNVLGSNNGARNFLSISLLCLPLYLVYKTLTLIALIKTNRGPHSAPFLTICLRSLSIEHFVFSGWIETLIKSPSGLSEIGVPTLTGFVSSVLWFYFSKISLALVFLL